MFTKVLLIAQERRRTRLFFGEPLSLIQAKIGPDLNEMHALFRPHAIFGLEVWEANEYGTISWRFYILKTVTPGEKLNRIPEVVPGAQILLRVSGKEKVAKVKAWLKALAHEGTNPSHIPSEYFLSSHSKLRVGLEPRNFRKPHGKVLSFLKRRGG